MARGGVRPAPYRAVFELYDAIGDGRGWHLFDGWCAARNVDPLELTAPRFLDLIHYFIIEHTEKTEDRKKITDRLTGRMSTQLQRVDDRGIPIPDWWDDSETTLDTVMNIGSFMRGR